MKARDLPASRVRITLLRRSPLAAQYKLEAFFTTFAVSRFFR
jgi:hypothetical protein